ncbi:pyridoxal phosphate-dependent transferase [Haematococcus lacustris]
MGTVAPSSSLAAPALCIAIALLPTIRLLTCALRKIRGGCRGGQADAHAATCSPSFCFIDQPGSEHVALTPPWLKEAVAGSSLGEGGSSESLPAAPPPELTPPALQEFKDAVQRAGGQLPLSFGMPARQQLFCLEPDAVYLNHGSYGAAFRLGVEVAHWYQLQLEAQPVRFMETAGIRGLVAAVAQVARWVGAGPADVVPVPNATTAVNAVLHSLPLRKGDVILVMNTTYPAVRSAAARTAAKSGARLLLVNLAAADLSPDPRAVIAIMRRAVAAVAPGRLALAILDHVISFPPVILPVKELVEVCRQAGARVLLDGAHAFGSVPDLDVPSLGADYYTSNLHKWGCCPKGAAFLWAHPRVQSGLLPLVTSHGYGQGFRAEFLWQGTQSPSAWLAAPACLAVLHALGPSRVACHNSALVLEAANSLRDQLAAGGEQGDGLSSPAIVGGDGQGGNAGMLAVRLPPLTAYPAASTSSAGELHDMLRQQHGIEVPVVRWEGSLWVRLSAQIYNTPHDYQRLVDVLKPLLVCVSVARGGSN